MSRLELAFELMYRWFKKVQGKPDGVGLRFIQETIPVTIGMFDRQSVWVKIPMDAILSFSVPEDEPDVQQD
jgi:hypothetical protein